jgi:opine dehydrogenase
VAADVTPTVTVRGAYLVGTYRLGSDPAPMVAVAGGVDEAIAGVEAVLVATPSLEQSSVAGLLAPHLRPEQLVVLVPGRCFGAAEFRRELQRCGVGALPAVGELSAPPYLATTAAPGQLMVHARLARVAASPNTARLSSVWPSLDIVDSALATSFSDLLGVLNVAPLVLNTAMADGGRGPRRELMTSTVATVCEAVDRERRAVAFAFGVRDLPSAAEAVAAAHGLPIDGPASLHEVWHAVEAFDDLVLPGTSLRRQLGDDVACSLVPLGSAGRCAGIPTPATDALVATASLLAQVDYGSLGRSLGSLGLSSLTPEGVRRELV